MTSTQLPLLSPPQETSNVRFNMAETPKRHDFQTSADLERVTDYAEEKEINTSDLENVSVLLCNVL